MKQEQNNDPTNHSAKEDIHEEKALRFGVLTPSEMQRSLQPLQEKALRSLQDRACNEAGICIGRLCSELRKGKTTASLAINSKDNIKNEVIRLIILAFATAGWFVCYSPYDDNVTVRYPGLKEST